MIRDSEIKTNYSSNVALYLIAGDESWKLASIGPSYVTLRDNGIELDPCEAQILMIVDGYERRWNVFLKNGAVPFEPDIQILNLD